MIIFGFFLALVFFLFIWKRVHIHYQTLIFKYKIYAVRDRLRLMAIKGEIDRNNWVFDYYDNTLSKVINESYYITLFRLCILFVKYRNFEPLQKLNIKLNEEIAKSEILRNIQKDFTEAVKEYVFEQHKITVKYILIPIIFPLIGLTVATVKLNSWINSITVFPDTSDSKRLIAKV